MSDQETPSAGRSMLALAGGFGLSFLGLGLLWIGTPWPIQALMAVPYFILTWALTRGASGAANQLLTFVLTGAAPLGGLIMMFRDKNDSHLNSILTVAAWAAGAALGRLAARPKA